MTSLVLMLGATLGTAAGAVPPADAALAAAAELVPAVEACPAADDPGAHHREQRLAMQCLVGRVRAQAGLPPLRESAGLRHSATYKARRIAACRRFTHQPCGDAFAAAFAQARVARQGRWDVAEDLAWGVGQAASAQAVLAGWLASPAHRAILLDPGFTHLGVRRRRLRMDGAPAGAVLWVAHLGRRATR